MKSITKLLLVMSSFAPFAAGAAGPVSQTAGSNLTGYNGAMGSVIGNQWNNATNPRINMQNTNVKADYGNCNAVILRCAKPKCSGGGCASADVARPIVAGCVNTNATCKQHGDGLIDYISAQLVADSVAEANRQASASAAAASEQNAQQIAQMQQQMSQQMQMMQEQNNAQIASLQNALEESQRATAEAVQAAAQQNRAAPVADVETGLTATQQAAAKSGVSEDTIARATITGQILTSMEGVDSALNNLKTTMRDAFKYGGCNTINGNNCSGPKRVAKFRELANKFFEPYEALSDNLEDALLKAQSVGVDLGNIYMFFSGTCNRWAEYVCRGDVSKKYYSRADMGIEQGTTITNTMIMPLIIGTAYAGYNDNGSFGGSVYKTFGDLSVDTKLKGTDTYRSLNFDSNGNPTTIIYTSSDNSTSTRNYLSGSCVGGKSVPGNGIRGGHDCYPGQVVPPEDLVACSVNRFLDPENDADKVTEKILNPDDTENGSVRVGCASDLSGGIIKRRRSSSKKGGVDIDLLEIMINQSEGGISKFDDVKNICGLGKGKDVEGAISKLKSATVSKGLGNSCCSEDSTECNKSCYDITQDISSVDPLYALCDTHAWNAGYENNDDVHKSSSDKEKMQEIIGLKTTVIAQQMYKQYSELETMLKQLKIMLEKEVLKSNLKVASGTSDDNDSSSSIKVEFESCSAKSDEAEVLSCLRSNLAKYESFVNKGNTRNDVKKAMVKDRDALRLWLDTPTFASSCKSDMDKKGMQDCYNELAKGSADLNKLIKNESRDQKLLEAIYNNKR